MLFCIEINLKQTLEIQYLNEFSTKTKVSCLKQKQIIFVVKKKVIDVIFFSMNVFMFFTNF